MKNLIDTHSHIHFRQNFPDMDVIKTRAFEAGVFKQILVGCNLPDSLNAKSFAESNENFWWTIGVHPHDTKDFALEDMVKFEKILMEEKKNPQTKLRAIGECGLDYFRNLSPIEIQKKIFIWQLQIAEKYDLPVVIHIRDAYHEAFDILKNIGYKKIILHCFSGGLNEAYLAWNVGYITSFSGVVTYPKNDELRQCAKEAPQDLIVVETDCPFLAPQKFRGQRNEPAFVAETARVVAEERGMSLESFAELSTANAERFFKI